MYKARPRGNEVFASFIIQLSSKRNLAGEKSFQSHLINIKHLLQNITHTKGKLSGKQVLKFSILVSIKFIYFKSFQMNQHSLLFGHQYMLFFIDGHTVRKIKSNHNWETFWDLITIFSKTYCSLIWIEKFNSNFQMAVKEATCENVE